MPKFSKNDLVFAKVKGYPSWPAIITDYNLKNKKYKVKFYGTGETGLIKEEDLRYYLQCKDQEAGKSGTIKRKDYVDALTEIQTAFRKAKTDGSDISDLDKITVKVETEELSRKVVAKRKTIIEIENKPKVKRINSKRQTVSTETSDGIERTCADVIQEKPIVIFKQEHSDNIQEAEVSVENSLKNRSGSKKSKRFSTGEVAEPASKPIKKSIKIKKCSLDNTGEKESSVLEATIYTIVPVDNVEILIKYFDTIKDKAKFKKIAPQDLPPPSDKTYVIRAIVPKDASFLGIPYHEKRMPKFNSEFERALYESKEARRVIQLKDDIETGVKTVDDVSSSCILLDGKNTEVERNSILENWLHQKQKKLQFLKIESDLLIYDSGIKNSLGFDSADTNAALEHLKAMKSLLVEPLMLKKHPQVFEMVQRLQRYVGNIEEWNMSREEADTFREASKKIRVDADQIFDKFYTLMLKALPEPHQINDTIFWTKYMEEVERLRQETSHMKEIEVFVMSSEPSSRASILESLSREIISGKSIYEATAAFPDSSTTKTISEKTYIDRMSNDADSSTTEVEGRINIIGNE